MKNCKTIVTNIERPFCVDQWEWIEIKSGRNAKKKTERLGKTLFVAHSSVTAGYCDVVLTVFHLSIMILPSFMIKMEVDRLYVTHWETGIKGVQVIAFHSFVF